MALAHAGSDTSAYFSVVRSTELLLPAFAHDRPGGGQRFVTRDLFGRTHLLVFTSVEALVAQVRDVADAYARTSYAELRRVWPDSRWRLAINHGSPIDAYVTVDMVEQAASGDVRVPTGADVVAAARAATLPDTVDAEFEAAMIRIDVDGYLGGLLNSLVIVLTSIQVDGIADLLGPDFPWLAVSSPPPGSIQVFTSRLAYARTHPRPGTARRRRVPVRARLMARWVRVVGEPRQSQRDVPSVRTGAAPVVLAHGAG